MSAISIPKYVTGPRDKILASTPADNTIAKSTDTSELFMRINGGWEIYSFNRTRGSGGHGTYNLYGTIIDAPISSHIDACDPTTMTDTNGVQLSPDAQETYIAGGVRHAHNRDVISHITNYNTGTVGTSRASYNPDLFGGAGGIHFPARTYMQQLRNYSSNMVNEQTYFIVYEFETHYSQEDPLRADSAYVLPISPFKDPDGTADDRGDRAPSLCKIMEGIDPLKSNSKNQEAVYHVTLVERQYNSDLKFLTNYHYTNRSDSTYNSSTTTTTHDDNVYKELDETTLKRFKTPHTEKGIVCIRQSSPTSTASYNDLTGEEERYHLQADHHLTTVFGGHTQTIINKVTPIVNPTIGSINTAGYVNIAEFVLIDDYISTTDMQNIIQGMCNKFDLPYLGQ